MGGGPGFSPQTHRASGEQAGPGQKKIPGPAFFKRPKAYPPAPPKKINTNKNNSKQPPPPPCCRAARDPIISVDDSDGRRWPVNLSRRVPIHNSRRLPSCGGARPGQISADGPATLLRMGSVTGRPVTRRLGAPRPRRSPQMVARTDAHDAQSGRSDSAAASRPADSDGSAWNLLQCSSPI